MKSSLPSMQGDAGAEAKHGIFVLIWNCSTEHFQVSRQALAPSAETFYCCHSSESLSHVQAKGYGAAAKMYAAALMYAPGVKEKAQAARQLALCQFGLGYIQKQALLPLVVHRSRACDGW